jgi:hypothetical protein
LKTFDHSARSSVTSAVPTIDTIPLAQ